MLHFRSFGRNPHEQQDHLLTDTDLGRRRGLNDAATGSSASSSSGLILNENLVHNSLGLRLDRRGQLGPLLCPACAHFNDSLIL